MKKMNQEIKEQWVEALRSGKYKQGQGQLRDDNNKFCCLGVLCNLHAQAHPEIAAQQEDPSSYLGGYEFPPKEVLKWAGLNSEEGEFVDEKGEGQSLAELNDEGRTFRYLANRIEKFL